MVKHTLSLVACATLVASLGAETLSLEPLVVSATHIQQSLQNTTSDIQILTSEDLEERHITTVLDALRTLTTINVAQSGGIGQQSSFFQRGFGSENTVVMIDGIRYNDPTTTKGQSQLEHLMINNIERIEIINGAQSGVWGANAVAGVINIITKKATQQLSIGSNIEYGSYATTKIAIDASQKVGPLSYYIGANQIKSDSFSAQTPRGEDPSHYEEDPYKNQTFNAKLNYDIGNSDSIYTQFTFIDGKTHYDRYAQPNSTSPQTHQINRLGHIGYQHIFDSKNSIDITYAQSNFDKEDPTGDTKAFKGTSNELNVLGSIHYMGDSTLVIGANKLDSKESINVHELDSTGLFATNTNRFGTILLTESLRHDRYDSFDNKTTGKIGIKYFIADDFTLSSNYGTAYRTPSLYELYASNYGNPNLQPETTKSFDATIRFKGLSATYYNNHVDNLIGFDPMTYVNEQVSGTSILKGYELSYNTLLANTLAIDVFYNRLDAKDKDRKNLQRRAQKNAMATLTYYPSNTLSVGTTANYTGTRYDTDYNTFPSSEIQTGRYTLWSAFMNYSFSNTVSMYIKAENLSDKIYQEVEGYGTAGRSFYAGLNARF